MKFERIGLIYLGIGALCIVIFVPLAIAAIGPVMKLASESMASMIDYFLLDTQTSQTQQFARALIYSFTGAFIVFMGIGTLIQNWQFKHKHTDNDIDL